MADKVWHATTGWTSSVSHFHFWFGTVETGKGNRRHLRHRLSRKPYAVNTNETTVVKTKCKRKKPYPCTSRDAYIKKWDVFSRYSQRLYFQYFLQHQQWSRIVNRYTYYQCCFIIFSAAHSTFWMYWWLTFALLTKNRIVTRYSKFQHLLRFFWFQCLQMEMPYWLTILILYPVWVQYGKSFLPTTFKWYITYKSYK